MSGDVLLRKPPTNGINLQDLPDELVPQTIAEPLNLAPGYVVQTTQSLMSVNGSTVAASSPVVLDGEGYYEVDVGDVTGAATRYPICIVDPTRLAAALAPPLAGQPRAFRRLADSLAAAYPHGRVLPFVQDQSHQIDATVDRAVYLQIRARPRGGSYAPATTVLAKRAGTWRSSGFNLPYGACELRLAVVLADPGTVLT
jgi:hypothetical protein